MTDVLGAIISADEISARKKEGSHPWNDNSLFKSTQLSRAVSMERSIVVHVIIPPGKESFVPHTQASADRAQLSCSPILRFLPWDDPRQTLWVRKHNVITYQYQESALEWHFRAENEKPITVPVSGSIQMGLCGRL